MASASQSTRQLSPGFLAWLNEPEEGDVHSTALTPGEVYWRDHQVWLEQKGYMLRPRYHPGWVSSAPDGRDVFWLHEDSIRQPVRRIIVSGNNSPPLTLLFTPACSFA